MNRTTKAKYDLAERMLNVHIEPAEVAIMSDLPLEEVEKLKANLMKTAIPAAQPFRTIWQSLPPKPNHS